MSPKNVDTKDGIISFLNYRIHNRNLKRIKNILIQSKRLQQVDASMEDCNNLDESKGKHKSPQPYTVRIQQRSW